MKMLKTFFIILIISFMLFSVVGCASHSENTSGQKTDNEVSAPAFPNSDGDSTSPPAFPQDEVNQ